MEGVVWFAWLMIIAVVSAAFAVGLWKQGRKFLATFFAIGGAFVSGVAYWVTTIPGFL